MNIQLPVAVGLSPGQPPITPLDPADDARPAFAELLGALQDGADDDGDGWFDDAAASALGSDAAEQAEALGEGVGGSSSGADSAGPELEVLDAVATGAPAPTGLLDAPRSVLGGAAARAGASRGGSGGSAALQAQPAPQAAQASLVSAGRAAPPAPELGPLPGTISGTPASAIGRPSGAGTLDAAPWFAVRAAPAGARGQALARAVQPALTDTTPLATRAFRGATRSGTGPETLLGSTAEVQSMVDGELAVRATDLVHRAVSHSAAQGAMHQAQRARVELPNRVLGPAVAGEGAAAAPPLEPAVPAVETASAEAAPPDASTTNAAAGDAAPGAARGAPGASTAARAAAQAPAAPIEIGVGAESPGVAAPAEAAATMTRTGAVPSGAAADAALGAGRPTEAQLGQVAVPDSDHMELKVTDGEHSFRLSIAREADGLNVELKAPREIVADLRALEPEVEAALAEDGYELASFDAQTDDSHSEGSSSDEDASGAAAGASSGSAPDAPPPVAPPGQGHLVNRLA